MTKSLVPIWRIVMGLSIPDSNGILAIPVTTKIVCGSYEACDHPILHFTMFVAIGVSIPYVIQPDLVNDDEV